MAAEVELQHQADGESDAIEKGTAYNVTVSPSDTDTLVAHPTLSSAAPRITPTIEQPRTLGIVLAVSALCMMVGLGIGMRLVDQEAPADSGTACETAACIHLSSTLLSNMNRWQPHAH